VASCGIGRPASLPAHPSDDGDPPQTDKRTARAGHDRATSIEPGGMHPELAIAGWIRSEYGQPCLGAIVHPVAMRSTRHYGRDELPSGRVLEEWLGW